jgi:hypothetical protein
MYDSCLHVVHHSNGLTPRQVGNQIFRNESFQHSSLRLCSKWTVQKAPVYNLLLFLLWHNWFFPVSGLYSKREGVVDRTPGENLIFPQSESCLNKNFFSIGRGTGQCSFFYVSPHRLFSRLSSAYKRQRSLYSSARYDKSPKVLPTQQNTPASATRHLPPPSLNSFGRRRMHVEGWPGRWWWGHLIQ